MNKRLAFLSLLLVLGIAWNVALLKKRAQHNQVIGKWYTSSQNWDTQLLGPLPTTPVFEIKRGGEYTGDHVFAHGTWQIQGNELVLISDGSAPWQPVFEKMASETSAPNGQNGFRLRIEGDRLRAVGKQGGEGWVLEKKT